MIQSRGWLKPIKLKEITGTPAAEVIAKELKEGRERKKREEYIRKYASKMATKENAKGFSFAQHHPSVPSLHAAENIMPVRQSANTATNRRLVKEDGALVSVFAAKISQERPVAKNVSSIDAINTNHGKKESDLMINTSLDNPETS